MTIKDAIIGYAIGFGILIVTVSSAVLISLLIQRWVG